MAGRALLIDAENLSPYYWKQLETLVGGRQGIPVVKLFGDFTEGNAAGWTKYIASEVQPIMQGRGRNAADIGIAVAAMDLLHAGRAKAIWIASSDSDYTALVHRLREGGLDVFVCGEAKTPKCLQQAATQFHKLKPKPKIAIVAKNGAKAA